MMNKLWTGAGKGGRFTKHGAEKDRGAAPLCSA